MSTSLFPCFSFCLILPLLHGRFRRGQAWHLFVFSGFVCANRRKTTMIPPIFLVVYPCIEEHAYFYSTGFAFSWTQKLHVLCMASFSGRF